MKPRSEWDIEAQSYAAEAETLDRLEHPEECPCGHADALQEAFETHQYQTWLDAEERRLLLLGIPAAISEGEVYPW